MRIIPAIDIIGGKCVRLAKGDYSTRKIYNENPLEVAKSFEENGLENLHLVDLDGARSNHIVNWRVLEKIANKTSLKIDFGGGLKSNEDLKIAFESGAKQITAGSIAVKDSELFLSWLHAYGSDKIILGADVLDGKIAISGWEEGTEKKIEEFIDGFLDKGIRYVIATDISKDGMLGGPSFELYASILKKKDDIKLIASGGVASIDDLRKLREQKLEGAILGKAIYEGRILLKDLRKFNA